MLNGGLDIGKLFPFIAPHQEHPGLDSVRLAKGNRTLHLLDRYTPFHGVQNSLRPALGADPDAEASNFGQRFYDSGIETIRPRNALEWNTQSASFEFRRVLKEPAVMDGEYVIGHPNNFGVILTDAPFQFVRH